MKLKGLLVSLAVLTLIVSPFFVVPRYLKVEKISCSSQFGPCNYELQKELTSFEGKALVEAKSGARSVLESNVKITDYFMRFQLPNRIIVDVVERKSYFALRQKGNELVALVDSDGSVVSFQENTSLPTLNISSTPPGVGEKADDRVVFAAELLLDMYTSYQVREGFLEEDMFTVDLLTGETVIFPLEGDREILLGSLVAILSRLKQADDASRIETANVSEIDLRFKNPVLR